VGRAAYLTAAGWPNIAPERHARTPGNLKRFRQQVLSYGSAPAAMVGDLMTAD
jgi:hypothetical protein